MNFYIFQPAVAATASSGAYKLGIEHFSRGITTNGPKYFDFLYRDKLCKAKRYKSALIIS
jgi:hypothetical protein